MSEKQVIGCLWDQRGRDRGEADIRLVLQEKWKLAKGRILQAGGCACWVLGAGNSSVSQ